MQPKTIIKRIGIIVLALYAACITVVTFLPRDKENESLSSPQSLSFQDFASYSSSGKTLEYNNGTYDLESWRYSYFDFTNGFLEENPGYFSKTSTINAESSAFIVMDPWIDTPSTIITEETTENIENKLFPLIDAAEQTGHKIIVLTNDPGVVEYSTQIHPLLQAMVDEGRAELFYHQDYSTESFTEYLQQNHIDTLFYTGYSSVMCIY